jgi:hypothetical protein
MLCECSVEDADCPSLSYIFHVRPIRFWLQCNQRYASTAARLPTVTLIACLNGVWTFFQAHNRIASWLGYTDGGMSMATVGEISPLTFLCPSTHLLVAHAEWAAKLQPVTFPNTGTCIACGEPGLMDPDEHAEVVEVTAVTVLGVFPMHLAKVYKCSGCSATTRMCRAGLLQINCTAPTVRDPATIITMEVINLLGGIEDQNPSVSPHHVATALTVLGKHRRGKKKGGVSARALRESMLAAQEIVTACRSSTGALPAHCPACV